MCAAQCAEHQKQPRVRAPTKCNITICQVSTDHTSEWEPFQTFFAQTSILIMKQVLPQADQLGIHFSVKSVELHFYEAPVKRNTQKAQLPVGLKPMTCWSTIMMLQHLPNRQARCFSRLSPSRSRTTGRRRARLWASPWKWWCRCRRFGRRWSFCNHGSQFYLEKASGVKAGGS